jgi:hypothetical protein
VFYLDVRMFYNSFQVLFMCFCMCFKCTFQVFHPYLDVAIFATGCFKSRSGVAFPSSLSATFLDVSSPYGAGWASAVSSLSFLDAGDVQSGIGPT